MGQTASRNSSYAIPSKYDESCDEQLVSKFEKKAEQLTLSVSNLLRKALCESAQVSEGNVGLKTVAEDVGVVQSEKML